MSRRGDTQPDLLGPEGIADLLNQDGVEAKKKAFSEQAQAREGFQDSVAKLNEISDGASLPVTPPSGLGAAAPQARPADAQAIQPADALQITMPAREIAKPTGRATVRSLQPAPLALLANARPPRPPSVVAVLALAFGVVAGLALFSYWKVQHDRISASAAAVHSIEQPTPTQTTGAARPSVSASAVTPSPSEIAPASSALPSTSTSSAPQVVPSAKRVPPPPWKRHRTDDELLPND